MRSIAQNHGPILQNRSTFLGIIQTYAFKSHVSSMPSIIKHACHKYGVNGVHSYEAQLKPCLHV